MNKINLRVRAKNPTWVMSIVATVSAFVYQMAALFEVVPPISQDQVMEFAGLIVTVLAGLGVLIDPTTKGVGDSERALGYTEPGGSLED